ncbi:MAG TPA: monovalent cation:proton antiporter-2 (CPA2) family protein [Bdellovibrionales bacterium]|nr:monovalent cation:proton antiporter-2 (CPA2) family protein [Bdellovibrionales bacterium]
MHSPSFLSYLVVFLAAAVIVVPVSKRLGMGSVLGYLIAGSIVGPWGFKLITDVEGIMHFAEFGVVLLLFIIGLELKPSRLWVMRKAVFGTGGLQVLLTAAAFAGLGIVFGLTPLASVLLGFALSLSSTAFVLQILAEKNQLNTEFGRLSFAILLFQDIATIPVLAAVPLLASKGETPVDEMIKKTLIAVAAIAGIIIGGRYLLRHVFRAIAASRIKEIFTAATLLLVVGTALIMSAVGLSMALGTFLAGVLLADSEYRHELETDIDPFKGLLLGLFFMSVGMGVDYGLILNKPLTIVGLVIGIMAIKAVLLYGLARYAGLANDASRNLAVALPQVGEFAFVLLAMITAGQLADKGTTDLLVVVVTVSMALTPLLFAVNEKFIGSKSKIAKPYDEIKDESNPVIVAGYGRFGQIVTRILRLQDIGFTALEIDSEQVEVVRRFGAQAYYGDASRLDLLRAAGADKAKLFVLAIDNMEASLRVARMVREHFPKLKILARARNRQHAYDLMDLGVTAFHRETYGSSLWLARDALIELGVDKDMAARLIESFSRHDEKILLEQYKLRHDQKSLVNYSKQAAQLLVEIIKADIKDIKDIKEQRRG